MLHSNYCVTVEQKKRRDLSLYLVFKGGGLRGGQSIGIRLRVHQRVYRVYLVGSAAFALPLLAAASIYALASVGSRPSGAAAAIAERLIARGIAVWDTSPGGRGRPHTQIMLRSEVSVAGTNGIKTPILG